MKSITTFSQREQARDDSGKLKINLLLTIRRRHTQTQLQVENGGEIGLANLFMTYFPHSQSSGWTFVMGIVRMCDFKGLTLETMK